MKVDGACHCGHVTYQAEIDAERVALCHCADCQTFSGSAFRTIVPVVAGTLVLRGEPTVYVKTAESGKQRQQAFCPHCGTAIYSAATDKESNDTWLRVGAIRQRDRLPPKVQMWARSRQHWLDDLAAVPRVETQ